MEIQTFNAVKDLEKDVQSIEDAAILREMVMEEEGGHDEFSVYNAETGETETVAVLKLGKGALEAREKPAIELASASTDWHTPEH